MKSRQRDNRVVRIFRYVYLRLIRKNDSPERVGRGAGLGIFIGIFPTLWFGPALAIFSAGLMGANRAAALLGSFVCGPLTPLTWTLAVIVGNLMVAPEWRVATELISYDNRALIGKQFLMTFMVGNFTISILFGLLGYALVWRLAARRQRKVSLRRAAEPQREEAL